MNKKNKGFTLVELLVVIGILGILMGALFPAISSAMVKANLSACGMRGRNLFVAITAANTEREALGLGNCWPQEAQENADENDKIAKQGTPDALTYFKYLFDTDNFGKETWKPYVSGIDIGVLAGAGVPVAAKPDQLQSKNILWTVLSNVSDELDDVLPVLVSRNLDDSKLVVSGTYSGDSQDIELGKVNATPFGNKAFVCIRKGGAVITQTSKYATTGIIYNRQSFTIPTLDNPPKYLRPEAK